MPIYHMARKALPLNLSRENTKPFTNFLFSTGNFFFVTNISLMQGECPYDYLLDMALIREFHY